MAGWLLAQAGSRRPPGPMTIAPMFEDGHIELCRRHLARPCPAGAVRAQCRAHRRPRITERRRHGRTGAGARGWRSATEPASPANRATRCRSTARAPPRSPPRRRSTCRPGAVRRRGARAADGRRARTHSRPVGAMVAGPVQFGRPIAKFQAVQHNLAALAGEVAAAGAAANAAARRSPSTGSATSESPPRSRSPNSGSARRPAPAPRSPTGARRDGSPTSIAASRDPAAWAWRESWATKPIGRPGSATWSRRAAPTSCGRS